MLNFCVVYFFKKNIHQNFIFTDRTLMLWCIKDLGNAKDRKSLRVNVEYDHAVKLSWSPDTKAVLVHKAIENCVEVYKVNKVDGWFTNPTKGITFKKSYVEEDIVGFGIACSGRFILTASNKTDLILWDLKGHILDRFDSYLMNNNCAKISPCGRFIGVGGFAPDAKIWEIKFDKSGEYQKSIRAFDLSGHTSGIYDLAFDQDTSHVATVSKDGTWKIFHTRIEYEKGESPRCLITAHYNQASSQSKIALSMNGEVVAIAGGQDIELFSAITGQLDQTIENIYTGFITCLKFDALGKYLFTSGDKYIKVFHNVTGYRVAVDTAKTKLKSNQTAATRERLEKQIEEYENFIKQY